MPDTPSLLLMGPGPSMVSPRVQQAMTQSMMGHMDPDFIAALDEISGNLRAVFQTQNPFTICISGTGMSGMEAAFTNLVRPGERVLIFQNGYFGARMANIARRQGGDVEVVEKPWGSVFTIDEVRAALTKHQDIAVVAIVHAETSTGALQPMEGIGELVHGAGALLIMDCVTSVGGVEVAVDAWGVDAAYSGAQKCLSCPPGLALLTLSERAMTKIRMRKIPVRSYYLDALELELWWSGDKRAYHHGASWPLYSAMREGLRMVMEEGLPARWARHTLHGNAARAGLAALGFGLIAPVAIPHLIAATIPAGVDDLVARRTLLKKHRVEVGGGFGDFAGHLWRIGVMGESCRREHVTRLISAIEETFTEHGWPVTRGAGQDALEHYYAGR